MVAIVQIREETGATPTYTDKTSGTVRMKMADDATVDANNPLIIPATNQNYTYEKWLRLYIGVTGPDTSITNPKVYMDGSNDYGTGVKLWVILDGAHSTPVSPSIANDPPEHDAVAMTNAFTYTSGAPLAIDATNAGPYSGTSINIADHVIFVMEAEAGATQGSLSAETCTFVYDES